METKSKRTRTVTWDDPFTAVQAASGKTGLELLKEFEKGNLQPPPIAKLMGFVGTNFEEGKAVFEGEPAEYLYNPIGVVHAGFAMTLLDSALGCAVHSTLAVGERYTTLETKCNFVRAITIDTGRVRCEATILHRGSTTATAEGRLTAVATGKLLAHGSTTCLVVGAR